MATVRPNAELPVSISMCLVLSHSQAAKVPVLSLHCARHSSVTAMIEAGVQDHVVAAWHGHDLAVMRGTYLHAGDAGLAAAGEALEATFGSQGS